MSLSKCFYCDRYFDASYCVCKKSPKPPRLTPDYLRSLLYNARSKNQYIKLKSTTGVIRTLIGFSDYDCGKIVTACNEELTFWYPGNYDLWTVVQEPVYVYTNVYEFDNCEPKIVSHIGKEPSVYVDKSCIKITKFKNELI